MIQDNIYQWTENYMNVWMRAWEEASVAAVERVVTLFAPDGVYHATPFSEGVGHEGIRVYESMIRTQQNGQGSVELLGVAGKHGVYRWFIEYDVLPKNLWASRLPQTMIDSLLVGILQSNRLQPRGKSDCSGWHFHSRVQ